MGAMMTKKEFANVVSYSPSVDSYYYYYYHRPPLASLTLLLFPSQSFWTLIRPSTVQIAHSIVKIHPNQLSLLSPLDMHQWTPLVTPLESLHYNPRLPTPLDTPFEKLFEKPLITKHAAVLLRSPNLFLPSPSHLPIPSTWHT